MVTCLKKEYKKSGCTDVFALILFIIFWALMIFIASFSLVFGEPSRLIYGYDTFGNVCGRKNSKLGQLSFSGLDMTTKKYLFFMDVTNIHQSIRICIEKCPNQELSSLEKLQSFSRETGSMLCRYDIPLINYTTANTFHNYTFKYSTYKSNGPCPLLPVPKSTSVLYRCLPQHMNNSKIIYNLYAYLNSLDHFQKIVSDVYLSWKEILGMCFLSSLLVLIQMVCLQMFTSVAVYFILSVTAGSAVVSTVLFWWCFVSLKQLLDNTDISQRLEEDVRNEQACLIYSIITTIVMIVLLLIIFKIKKKIKFVIGLINEANRCLNSVPRLFFQPFLSFGVFVVFFIFWIFIVLCMATSDFPIGKSANIPFTNMSYIDYENPNWVHYTWWYYVIGLILTSEFITSCQSMVVGGTCVHWYFKSDKNLYSPIIKTTYFMARYHLGSVIIGSIAIFLFKIPRLFTQFIHNSFKEKRSSMIGKYCLGICKSCSWCFKKFLRYINHNAYIFTVMNGSSFCKAGKEAFDLLQSNEKHVNELNSITVLFLFMGKCSIIGTTVSITLVILKMSHYHFYAVPIFIITLFTFFVSHCSLSLYEIIIDTMILCRCKGKMFYGKFYNDVLPNHSYLENLFSDYPKKQWHRPGNSTAV